MMILAVDLRNGTTSVGLSDSRHFLCRFRLTTANRTIDEWQFLIASYLRERGFPSPRLDGAILSSVVPACSSPVVEALARFLPEGLAPIVVGPGVKTGIRIRTDNPSEVGPSLVCEAVAAVEAVGTPCIVIGFNAALSFTAVDGKGDLVGVSIAPGLDGALRSLRESGALLPQVRLDGPVRAIGKNSSESIKSGILIGWSGLVNELVSAITAELDCDSRPVALVGTGDGDASPVAVRGGFALWNPWLALDGLALVAERELVAREKDRSPR